MRLGIAGSGKVGKALGTWAAKRGVPVVFASRRRESAREAAEAAGHGAQALELGGMVAASDAILLAVPFAEVVPALGPWREHLAGKILIDATNPITPDHRALTIGHDDSGAEALARAFASAHVVKAFNAVFAEVYAAQTTRLGGQLVSVFYAGDDSPSKRAVANLVTRLGFDAVDAGPLANSRYLEPLSLLNIHLGRELGLGTHIGFSLARA